MVRLTNILSNSTSSADIDDGISQVHILIDVCEVIEEVYFLKIDFPEMTVITPMPKVPKAKNCSKFRPINSVAPYENILELCGKE